MIIFIYFWELLLSMSENSESLIILISPSHDLQVFCRLDHFGIAGFIWASKLAWIKSSSLNRDEYLDSTLIFGANLVCIISAVLQVKIGCKMGVELSGIDRELIVDSESTDSPILFMLSFSDSFINHHSFIIHLHSAPILFIYQLSPRINELVSHQPINLSVSGFGFFLTSGSAQLPNILVHFVDSRVRPRAPGRAASQSRPQNRHGSR